MKNRQIELINAYKQKSNILNPSAPGPGDINQPVIRWDLKNLLDHKAELTGNEDGQYAFNGIIKTSTIPTYRAVLAELKKDYKNWFQNELNQGNNPPAKDWPAHLLEKKDQLEAHLAVYALEVEHLNTLIKEARLAKEEAAQEPCLGPKASWNRQEMENNVLTSIAGQVVKPDEKGVLKITDERSPYNGIYCWRFKSQILKPMNREYSYRIRQENKKAPDDRLPVKWPASPIFDPKKDSISYPGYAEAPLRKLGLLK